MKSFNKLSYTQEHNHKTECQTDIHKEKVINYTAWVKNYDPTIPAIHAKDSWLVLSMDAYILRL
jgi:hypothetical protein